MFSTLFIQSWWYFGDWLTGRRSRNPFKILINRSKTYINNYSTHLPAGNCRAWSSWWVFWGGASLLWRCPNGGTGPIGQGSDPTASHRTRWLGSKSRWNSCSCHSSLSFGDTSLIRAFINKQFVNNFKIIVFTAVAEWFNSPARMIVGLLYAGRSRDIVLISGRKLFTIVAAESVSCRDRPIRLLKISNVELRN